MHHWISDEQNMHNQIQMQQLHVLEFWPRQLWPRQSRLQLATRAGTSECRCIPALTCGLLGSASEELRVAAESEGQLHSQCLGAYTTFGGCFRQAERVTGCFRNQHRDRPPIPACPCILATLHHSVTTGACLN